MVLDKLILDNFLTYDHFEYDFENKPLLIQGLNLTDDNQKTNGTGKSGIQTGIEFCLTASNSRDVRDSELVTYGMPSGRTQLFASCDVRKENIHIDWTINVKGSNVLQLKKKSYNEEWRDDDSQNISFSNVNDGKKYILNWFAISKEDLFNYYIINNSRFKSFFKSSNREKVDLINRFSDASIIKGLENIDNSEYEEQARDAEKEVNLTQGKIDLLESQIENQRNRDFEAEFEEEVQDLKEEIVEEEKNIESIELNIDNINQKIKNIKEIHIIGINDEISDTNENKARIRSEISNLTANIKKINNELTGAKKLVDEFVSTDWDNKKSKFTEEEKEIEGNLSKKEKEKIEIHQKETRLLRFIQSLEVKLGGSITCPACDHKFLLDEDLKLVQENKKKSEEIKKTIANLLESNEKIISNARIKMTSIRERISEINKKESAENSKYMELKVAMNNVSNSLSQKESEIEAKKRKIDYCDLNLERCDNRIKDYNKDIDNLKSQINNLRSSILIHQDKIKSYESQISSLKVGNNKDYINTLKKDLKAVRTSLIKNRTELTRINDVIYERNQWMANFKQFRMYLANQSLEIIQYHCNRYLVDMGSDMKVQMDGFKVMANGTIKEEITAKIVRECERTYSSFSGGERGRLLFASILANRHMINETHPYGGLDFLAIDEVFEGIDGMGLKKLIESAKTLNIPVMIITHVTDEEASSDRILIVKENGISQIKKE